MNFMNPHLLTLLQQLSLRSHAFTGAVIETIFRLFPKNRPPLNFLFKTFQVLALKLLLYPKECSVGAF